MRAGRKSAKLGSTTCCAMARPGFPRACAARHAPALRPFQKLLCPPAAADAARDHGTAPPEGEYQRLSVLQSCRFPAPFCALSPKPLAPPLGTLTGPRLPQPASHQSRPGRTLLATPHLRAVPLAMEWPRRDHRRPPDDDTIMSFPAAVPPAHILSAPADGVALATLCPPGPKQNTSSARTSPWMIQRKCCNGRTCRMSMTITVPEGSFCEALDEQCTSSGSGGL